MLDVLVLSRPPSWRLRYFGGGSVSAAAHSAILTLIVFATGRSAAVQQALGFDTTLVYVAPHRTPEPDRQAEQEREQAARQVVLVDAPVKGFQTIAAITDIPNELPPVDLTERFDPRDRLVQCALDDVEFPIDLLELLHHHCSVESLHREDRRHDGK